MRIDEREEKVEELEVVSLIIIGSCLVLSWVARTEKIEDLNGSSFAACAFGVFSELTGTGSGSDSGSVNGSGICTLDCID